MSRQLATSRRRMVTVAVHVVLRMGLALCGLCLFIATPAYAETMHMDLLGAQYSLPRYLCIAYPVTGTTKLPAFTDELISSTDGADHDWPHKAGPSAGTDNDHIWHDLCLSKAREAVVACHCGTGRCEDGQSRDAARCTMRHQLCAAAEPLQCTIPNRCSFEMRVRNRERTATMAVEDKRQRYFLRCLANEQPTGARPAVLVVDVTHAGSTPPTLTSGRLSGATAVLQFSGDAEPLSMTAIGGDYITGASPVLGGRAQLKLEPRCLTRNVDIPRIVEEGASGWRFLARERDRAEQRERTLRGCDITARRTVQATLPEAADLVMRHGSPSQPHELVTQWPAGTTQVRRLRFAWTAAPCLVRLATIRQCPRVRLGRGDSCTATGFSRADAQHLNGRCHYACGSSHDRPFDLPTDLSFELGRQEDNWSDQLSTLGETLEDYASRADRKFLVDFSEWPNEARRRVRSNEWGHSGFGNQGDLIYFVELTAPDGSERRIFPDAEQRVAMSGITCGDLIDYRIVGDRKYDSAAIALRDGAFTIPPPSNTAHIWRLGAGLTGGFVFLKDGARPLASAAIMLRLRPRHWAWPASVEFSGLYVFSTHPFVGIQTDGVTSPGEKKRHTYLPYNRAFARVLFEAPVWHGLRIGVGAAIGGGWATLRRDDVALGDARPLLLVTPLAIGYDLGDHIAVGAAVHTIFNQRLYEFDIGDGQGSPERDGHPLWPLLLDAGIRVYY